MKAKIIIPGGSGFIGNFMADFFIEKNYDVTVLTRGKARVENGIRYLQWDGKNFGDWTDEFEGAALILNLAGKSVDCRYNEKNKKEITNSRVDATAIVGRAIQNCKHPPAVWMNMSTSTIYEHTVEGKANDEYDGIIGDDFSMGVAKAWERTVKEHPTPSTRRIILRTSIVLGKKGGAIKELSPLVKVGLGGKNGSGRQYISWIYEEDMKRIIYFLLKNKNSKGIYNIVSTTPIRNVLFMKKIRKALGVPFGLPATKWMIEIGTFFMRTESELVLKSRKVVPRKLLEDGFEFQFSDLDEVLKEILSK